jgi:hypothetical protein
VREKATEMESHRETEGISPTRALILVRVDSKTVVATVTHGRAMFGTGSTDFG